MGSTSTSFVLTVLLVLAVGSSLLAHRSMLQTTLMAWKREESENSGIGVPTCSDDNCRKHDYRNKREMKPKQHTCSTNQTTVTFPEGVPSFVIIGAQKSGSTALRKLLSQIPYFVPANKKEPHFFDRRIADQFHAADLSNITSEMICEARWRYLQYFDNINVSNGTSVGPPPPSSPYIYFEKTPAYMTYQHLPRMIDMVLPYKPKIIALLRNPVDRAYSAYNFLRGNVSEFATFEQRLRGQIYQLRKQGFLEVPLLDVSLNYSLAERLASFNNASRLRGHLGASVDRRSRSMKNRTLSHVPVGMDLQRYELARGIYVSQLREWINYFPLQTHTKVIQYERFKREPSLVIEEILDFVGAPAESYRHNLTIKDMTSELGPAGKHGVRGLEGLSMPNGDNTRREDTQLYSQDFYKPYNEDLADVLGEDWRNIWG